MPMPDRMTRLDRRTLVKFAALAGAIAFVGLPRIAAAREIDTSDLTDITKDAVPIGPAERQARLARAQKLMRDNGISAVILEPGASMIYFTGVEWWRSERVTAAILPAEGQVGIVTPFFEEPSVRESLGVPAEVRVWQEDEDPIALIAALLRDHGLAKGRIAIEESVRFFISNGLRQALPDVSVTSANPVVRGCRMVKTTAEIALMEKATQVTLAAYRWVYPRVQAGMTNHDISALMDAATRALGGHPEFSLVLLGEAAAYPHGSGKPQVVRAGEVVLMDCGCTVEGYQSDISRSWVHGKASPAQRKVWDEVAKGQQVALQAARLGAPAGSVDDAVRAYYESLGYGPRYQLPGLSHRTGHGIGLEGHEPVNLVHGEATRLAPGMCFSNEPGLYLPGKFGIRIEDCFHMTEGGPKWFSIPPTSIDAPLG